MDIRQDWTFSRFGSRDEFERHIREQLPWYALATEMVAHVGRHYIPRNGLVYDIGASTGNVGRALRETIEARDASLVAIESCAEMGRLYSGPGRVEIADATEFEFGPFDFAVCFLSMIFMPVVGRQEMIARLLRAVNSGGAILVFEKVSLFSGYLATVASRLTMAGKLAGGARAQEIVEKEMELIGVQRPLARNEIPDRAQQLFQFGDFSGFVIEG